MESIGLMQVSVDPEAAGVLKSQIAALEELLSVQERVVGEQSEKLKRYAEDLRRANEDVRQFAFIVSHDLRAPLINLKGFAAELRAALATLGASVSDALPHLSEEQHRAAVTALQEEIPEALGFIEASATRMDEFINAMLKLSRLGRRDLHFEPVNLNEIMETVLKGLAYQIEERRVAVTVAPLPVITADATAMEQILGNIMTNAVNYLDPGRPGRVEVGGCRDDGQSVVFVRDNGRGIAEADMPKVFALFRRAGKQDVAGEGMGLAYAQTLARRHGGHIRCESEFGVGTTFTVVLNSHLIEGDEHV